MQHSALLDMIGHAAHTVPYYKRLFNQLAIHPASVDSPDALWQLPVLTKGQIQDNPDDYMSSVYPCPGANPEVEILRTSGSTGRFLNIAWFKQDTTRSLFHLWRMRSRLYGIDPSSKCFSFHSTVYANNRPIDKIPEIEYINNGRILSISKLNLSEEKLFHYYKTIMEFEPEWFSLQPSVAYILAAFVSKHNLGRIPSLRYIELTGEYLFDHYREKISTTFGAPVVNMYGSVEVNGIAIECENGNMHCLSNNVMVELLKDDKPVAFGEEGEIHVTSLENRTMPFIRYKLGDRGVLYLADVCSCGNKNVVLKLLAGRVGEYIKLEDGRVLNSFIFVHAIESVNSLLGYPILQFQIIQDSYQRFLCNLHVGDDFIGWVETISTEFMAEMKKVGLEKLTWNIQLSTTAISNQDSGKLQFFICKIN